jgi:endonuclease YncB( thermonuclease family)
MFHTLRRVILLLSVLASALAVYGVSRQSDRYGVLFDLYDRRRQVEVDKQRDIEDARKISFSLEGRVVDVVDGRTLVIARPTGERYSVALAGVRFARWDRSVTVSRSHLARLALGREVSVAITTRIQVNSGMGIVSLRSATGPTLNEVMLASGWLSTDFPALAELPHRHAERFVDASRKARHERLGAWSN